MTEAEFPLAGVPGFHSLARTSMVGTAGPGGAFLDVYCACNAEQPVTQITVRTTRKPDDSFHFLERGRGKIVLTPALDLRSDHGHFVTESLWDASPDGWQQIGPIDKAKLDALKKSLTPKTAKTAAPVKLTSAQTMCGCGDPLSVHDPCSRCECPKFHKLGEVERYKRRK